VALQRSSRNPIQLGSVDIPQHSTESCTTLSIDHVRVLRWQTPRGPSPV
jgi:hypothetical protein